MFNLPTMWMYFWSGIFTHNCHKSLHRIAWKIKPSFHSSSVRRNTLLMKEVRGEWSDCGKLKESLSINNQKTFQNAQRIKPWGGWITAEEDHIRVNSWQPRTEIYRLYRWVVEVWKQKTCMSFSNCRSGITFTNRVYSKTNSLKLDSWSLEKHCLVFYKLQLCKTKSIVSTVYSETLHSPKQDSLEKTLFKLWFWCLIYKPHVYAKVVSKLCMHVSMHWMWSIKCCLAPWSCVCKKPLKSIIAGKLCRVSVSHSISHSRAERVITDSGAYRQREII